MTNTRMSDFTTVNELEDSTYVDAFTTSENVKIAFSDLKNQLQDEIVGTFIYPTIDALESADLEADADNPTYVRCEETEYRLYKITSVAASGDDIALNNGNTATFQEEYSKSGFVTGAGTVTDGAIVVFSGTSGTIIDEGAVPTDVGSNIIEAVSVGQDSYLKILADDSAVLRTIGQIRTDLSLNNVDNTSDANKPISNATQAALDLKANIASPVLTGNPQAPTPSANDNTASISTTAYVQTELLDRAQTVAAFADLATTACASGRRVVTSGYSTVGVGAANYIGKAGTATAGNPYQSASATVGFYWDIDEPILTVQMAGGTGTGDEHTLLQGALTAAGGRILRIDGEYSSSGTLAATVATHIEFLPEASLTLTGDVNYFIHGNGASLTLSNPRLFDTTDPATRTLLHRGVRVDGAADWLIILGVAEMEGWFTNTHANLINYFRLDSIRMKNTYGDASQYGYGVNTSALINHIGDIYWDNSEILDGGDYNGGNNGRHVVYINQENDRETSGSIKSVEATGCSRHPMAFNLDVDSFGNWSIGAQVYRTVNFNPLGTQGTGVVHLTGEENTPGVTCTVNMTTLDVDGYDGCVFAMLGCSGWQDTKVDKIVAKNLIGGSVAAVNSPILIQGGKRTIINDVYVEELSEANNAVVRIRSDIIGTHNSEDVTINSVRTDATIGVAAVRVSDTTGYNIGNIVSPTIPRFATIGATAPTGVLQLGYDEKFLAFADGDTTPSVKHRKNWLASNTGATSITNFDDGESGQTITVRATTANTTIVNGATIVTKSGANIAIGNGSARSFTFSGTSWAEV